MSLNNRLACSDKTEKTHNRKRTPPQDVLLGNIVGFRKAIPSDYEDSTQPADSTICAHVRT